MSEVPLPAHILTNDDGTDPRIVIGVRTAADLVQVESRARGRLLVRHAEGDAAEVAIRVARRFIRAHERSFEGLYRQIDRCLEPAPGEP